MSASNTFTLTTLIALTLCCTTAFGQEVHSSNTQNESVNKEAFVTPSLGVRIGGYGFRQLNENRENLDWENCRMDGFGLFGTLEFQNAFFAEVSADLYHANGDTLKQGIDRLSLHTVIAGGYRILPNSFITPNIQIGVGAEWTKVEMFGVSSQDLHPVAFAGLGGELNIKDFHFGVTVRGNVMQLPIYEWEADNGSPDSVDYETEIAGQMLFSVRYSL